MSHASIPILESAAALLFNFAPVILEPALISQTDCEPTCVRVCVCVCVYRDSECQVPKAQCMTDPAESLTESAIQGTTSSSALPCTRYTQGTPCSENDLPPAAPVPPPSGAKPRGYARDVSSPGRALINCVLSAPFVS
jgi:hypothetical protein